MNDKQIAHAIDTMDVWLEENYPTYDAEPLLDAAGMQEYKHLKHMIPQMRELAGYSPDDQATREKLMRWIGFMQGALWGLEHFTINEFREMNTHGNA